MNQAQLDLATMAAQHNYSHGQMEIGDAESAAMRDLLVGLVKASEIVIDRLTAWSDSARIIWTQTGSEDAKNQMENYGRLIEHLEESISKARAGGAF